MPPTTLLTIGVYGYTEEKFFQALIDSKTDCFCDIRSRRGLRGSQYAFANATRLQERLSTLNIQYIHFKDLAPSKTVREAQQLEDKAQSIGKRNRNELGETFKLKYHEETLSQLTASSILNGLLRNACRPIFFCVEQAPKACHRSLLTDELAKQTGLTVEHITP